MARNPKFPNSVEIKRVIAAAGRAGVEIGSIEIHPSKMIIHPRAKDAPPITDYDLWKMIKDRQNKRARLGRKTDALPKKPRGQQWKSCKLAKKPTVSCKPDCVSTVPLSC